LKTLIFNKKSLILGFLSAGHPVKTAILFRVIFYAGESLLIHV